jgi:hypothetical protein
MQLCRRQPTIILAVYPAAVALAMCLARPAHAQTSTVAGVVIDDRTSKPIKGVAILVENQSIVAETDTDGRFSLTAPRGRQTISASLIGYALLRTDVEIADAPLDMTIRLSEGAGAYTERVTVSGSLRREAEGVSGATSLHGRELETLRGAVLDDPLRAIQSLPSATATDDFHSEFAVRGNPFRYVGLVVDGVPTRYLMHTANVDDGGSIAMINSEVLGSVSLLPGSYPQRTGRQLGAEVDLATREGSRDGFRGRAGLSGTSAAILGEGPIANGKGSWLASARRSYLNYLIDRIDPDTGFVFGFVDAQGKAVYDVNARHQISITALLGRAVFEDDAASLGVNEIRTGISRAWLSSVSWRYLPGARWAITQRLYWTGLHFDYDNPAGVALDSARFSRLGWRADGSFTPASRAVVDFGGDFEQLDGRNDISRQLSGGAAPVALLAYKERARADSVYAQVRLDLHPRVTVTPGGRVDHWSLTGARKASPWINAEWRPSEGTRVRGGSGIYRQFPDLDQVFGIRGGGADLRPERAQHLDAGVEQALPGQTRVLFNVYSRRERDVMWTPGAEPRLSAAGGVVPGAFNARWVNALSGEARGIEMVVRRDAANGFTGMAGYAFGRLKYTDTRTRETFWGDADQRHTLSLYGGYRLSGRSSVSARYRYGSNYPVTGYIGLPAPQLGTPAIVDGQPVFLGLSTQRNALRLPPYSRLDVRADRAFTWSRRRLVAFVDVANVLNHRNLRNTSYVIDGAGRVRGRAGSLLPFVPSGGLVVEF